MKQDKKEDTPGFHPGPHQGTEYPGPAIADAALCVEKALFPLLLGDIEEAILPAVVLLARRLSAATPDAKHPGKCERKAGK